MSSLGLVLILYKSSGITLLFSKAIICMNLSLTVFWINRLLFLWLLETYESVNLLSSLSYKRIHTAVRSSNFHLLSEILSIIPLSCNGKPFLSLLYLIAVELVSFFILDNYSSDGCSFLQACINKPLESFGNRKGKSKPKDWEGKG